MSQFRLGFLSSFLRLSSSRRLILVAVLLLATFDLAAQTSSTRLKSKKKGVAKPEMSLREQALDENRTDLPKNPKTQLNRVDSDAQGIIKLENPYKDPRTRKFNPSVGLSFQTIQPEGQVSVEGSRKFFLKDNPAMIVPHLEIEAMFTRTEQNTSPFDYGIHFAGGFFSNTRRVEIPTSAGAADVTFSTVLVELGPKLTYSNERLGRTRLSLVPYLGFLNHTQSSSSAYARFSKEVGFWGFSFGPEYSLNDSFTLFGLYKSYNNNEKQDGRDVVYIQSNRVSLGFRKIW